MNEDRCPTCCVPFSEPPASDECPVPEQHRRVAMNSTAQETPEVRLARIAQEERFERQQAAFQNAVRAVEDFYNGIIREKDREIAHLRRRLEK